jgi:uncharacterized membrane protein YedE/YeeE
MPVASTTIALAGGVLIGAGASLLLLLNGRLGGVGGIVAGALPPSRGDWAWRVAFAAGLLGGGELFAWLKPSVFGPSPAGLPLLAVAGVVVGLGARLGGGCTSGHGICGFSVPTKRNVDRPLLLGSALFGVGWGLSGYCPGPVIVSLAAGSTSTLSPAGLKGTSSSGISGGTGTSCWRESGLRRPATTSS